MTNSRIGLLPCRFWNSPCAGQTPQSRHVIPHAFGRGSSFARRLGFMKHIRNSPEGRLAAIALQIDSLQARLCGTRMIDGRRQTLGPVETSFLEI